ncbi:hypothetical protein ACFYRL_00120 [Streptomyces goshikiensis]|uniref:hypothetical protein n=1 Tax=Streptomyces goshikiensis TaxID=1942 RepID=UPI0036B395BC
MLGNKANRTEFGDRFWWGRLPQQESDARKAAELPPPRGMREVLSDWIPPKPQPGGRDPAAAAVRVAPAAAGPARPVPSWTDAVAAFRTARDEVERLRAGHTRLAGALAAVESPSAGQRIADLDGTKPQAAARRPPGQVLPPPRSTQQPSPSRHC